MNSQNNTIAILDSGVGGLSIVRAIRNELPSLSIVYGCDNKNFPYGPKTPIEVIKCISNLTKQTIERFSPDLVVIACNTASTVALETLRQQSSVPIVGVVPAIKPAAAASRSKTIGLLATPGTIARPYTEQLIKEYASDCEVIRWGSTQLVELAEEKIRGKKVDLDVVKKELAPFFPLQDQSPIDTIVLGCTHFPLLLEELSLAAPKTIRWVDSSEAIANRVKALTVNSKNSSPNFRAMFTELNANAKLLEPFLNNLGFFEISKVC
jgi:glutamate racemase